MLEIIFRQLLTNLAGVTFLFKKCFFSNLFLKKSFFKSFVIISLSLSANMLYKAALKETRTEEMDSKTSPAAASGQPPEDLPHPYLLALGVLSVQKVRALTELLRISSRSFEDVAKFVEVLFLDLHMM